MSRISNLILLVGFLVTLGSAFMWFGNRKTLAIDNSKYTKYGPLVERNAAIDKAKSEGKSEYSFTTNFIPGIGSAPNVAPTPQK